MILARLGVAMSNRLDCPSAPHAMNLSTCHPKLLHHRRKDAINL